MQDRPRRVACVLTANEEPGHDDAFGVCKEVRPSPIIDLTGQRTLPPAVTRHSVPLAIESHLSGETHKQLATWCNMLRSAPCATWALPRRPPAMPNTPCSTAPSGIRAGRSSCSPYHRFGRRRRVVSRTEAAIKLSRSPRLQAQDSLNPSPAVVQAPDGSKGHLFFLQQQCRACQLCRGY